MREEIKKYFDNQASNWRNRYEILERFIDRLDVFQKEIMRILELNEIKSILEIGCGARSVIENIRLENIDYYACDYSFEMLKLNPISAMLFQADFYSLPLKKKFDVIIMSSVVEWLEVPEHSAKVISDFLNAGGFLLVSYPNGFSIIRIVENIILINLKKMFKKNHYKSMQRSVNYKIFYKNYVLNGFKLEKVVYFGRKFLFHNKYISSLRLDVYSLGNNL